MKKPLLIWETDWPKAAERFWSKVQKTDTCWLWHGTIVTKKSGRYGQFSIRKNSLGAHRVAYRWAYGPIPDGLQVDHKCRVTLCVNPSHLRLATNKQNAENAGLTKRNTSGIRGVTWVKEVSKWKAQLGHNGGVVYVGLFENIKDAESAVIAKRLELFTHNTLDRAA